MNRYEANKKILNVIANRVDQQKDLRFVQLLWGLGIIDRDIYGSIRDRFNEESEYTLNKLDHIEEKAPVSVVSCNNDLFICKCENIEHQLIFSHCSGDDNVYMTIHLSKQGFWKRLKYAIKYIFGYQSKYGAFDEFVFNKKDAHKLQSIVNNLRK